MTRVQSKPLLLLAVADLITGPVARGRFALNGWRLVAVVTNGGGAGSSSFPLLESP